MAPGSEADGRASHGLSPATRADPFPSGHTSRQWGRMIRRPDGRVEDEPWPWPDGA
jgi:hypothetical protein